MSSNVSGPPVVPRPQRREERNGSLALTDDALTVGTDGTDAAEAAATALRERLALESNGALDVGDDAAPTAPRIAIRRSQSLDWHDGDVEGAYEVAIDRDGARISAAGPSGLRHAVETVACLLVRDGDGWSFPATVIRDWPEWGWRSMLIDPARGHIPVERVEALLDKLTRAKMNRLHVHAIDREGCAIELESCPELTADEDQYYSIEEIEHIVEYAGERGITVVPEFELPGHATALLDAYPALRCSTPDDDPSDWTVCLGADAVYELLDDVAAELAERFETAVVHLGTDEWEFDTSWDDCSICERRMDANDLASERELFYDFLRRAAGVLGDHGLRTVVWNEQIDISESPPIPRELLVQFWVIRPDENSSGPTDGNSLERFLEEEFDVVNSFQPATYVDRHTTEPALLGWNPAKYPTVSDEYAAQVAGGELLAWSGWETDAWESYYRRALPSAIPAFADRVWNGAPVDDRASFVRGVGRHVFGPAVEEPGVVYDELGGLVLPVENDERAHVFESLDGRPVPEAKASYERTIRRLETHVDEGTARFPDAAAAYVECFEWLLERVDRVGRGIAG